MLEGQCHCGKLRWSYHGEPSAATACNCTVCSRYGALWIYGWEGEVITVEGPSTAYSRGKRISFHFCSECGCLVYYKALQPTPKGQTKIAANLRMINNPESVSNLQVEHFDGLNSFDDLPDDGRRVESMWF